MGSPPKIMSADAESDLDIVPAEVDPPFDGAEYSEFHHVPRPTDADVEYVARAVRKWRAVFIPLLGLADWELRFLYERGLPAPGDDDTAARVVTSSWMYKCANIHIYLHKCYDYEDEQLRYVIVHELCHLLVQPLTDWGPDEGKSMDGHFRAANERTVHNLAQAIIRAYDLVPPQTSTPLREEYEP